MFKNKKKKDYSPTRIGAASYIPEMLKKKITLSPKKKCRFMAT